MMMCKKHADTKRTSGGRSRAGRLSRIAALFATGFLLPAVLVAGWGGNGQTAIPQDDPFAGVEVLGAAEMAGKRGGFIDAALGISLNLGATILTAIDGSLILKTMVNFSDTGVTTVTNMFTPGATDLTSLTFLSADGTAIAGIAMADTTNPVSFSSGGVQITVPAGFQGLVAQTDTGIVAAVNNITSEQFANLVISADPGMTGADAINIQQTLQINIDVNGFSALQQTVRFNATMEKFRETMRSASLSSLGLN
jgi:hypothetical protein